MNIPRRPRPTGARRLRWIAAVLAGLLVAGCGTAPTVPSATKTPSPSSPSINLAAPGAASAAVSQLVAQTHGNPVIRITVTTTDATLTYVQDDQAITLDWDGGQVTPVDSGITYVDQQPFDPSDFNLRDIGSLFAQASAVAGSSAQQELQINEYNQGKVLMTVTTSPESQTIFFRPDGTMINAISFTTVAGITEAMADTTGDGAQVIQIGIDATQFWADVRVSPTEIEHRVRPAKLPEYTVVRKATTKDETFAPSQVEPAVVAHLMATLPAQLASPTSSISMVMDMRSNLGFPTMRFTVGLTTVVYSPSGNDITQQLH
ncbi:MAG: hypothetical protein FWF75_07835 [Propionibacteriaceae bacterium]|nr:hypothetical protein [Propionibacteriaceae bacterium]